MSERSALVTLANSIAACRKCDEASIRVRHARHMNRGFGTEILVVGIEPGRTEIRTGEDFSGAAGRRLMDWFMRAGMGENRDEIMARVHMTSICKCTILDGRLFGSAARNCYPFLRQQIEALNPRICVTLGSQPLGALCGGIDLETAVGRTWSERDLGILFPVLPPSCRIICLPHPSPRSTWLNREDHRALLEDALSRLRSEL